MARGIEADDTDDSEYYAIHLTTRDRMARGIEADDTDDSEYYAIHNICQISTTEFRHKFPYGNYLSQQSMSVAYHVVPCPVGNDAHLCTISTQQ